MLETPHIANEAAPGVIIETSGWILDSSNQPVEAAWFDIAGVSIPIVLDRVRVDVARQLGLGDREAPKIGFDTRFTLPAEVSPGIHDARVIGVTRDGGGVYAESARRIVVPYPRAAARAMVSPKGPIRFELRLRDTQPAPHTRGRGAHTIREESSLRVSGFVEGATAVHIVAAPAVGESVAWNIPCSAEGTFDAILWTGELKRGLYRLLIGRDNGAEIERAAQCYVDIAGPHYIPALHLTHMLAPPLAELLTFEDAGPSSSQLGTGAFVAGRPIGVSGWCLDPASATPPLAVYAQVDAQRPIPLSHRLADPRTEPAPETLCGFGGIIDTILLDPGSHRIRILAAAVSGAGWLIVDDRIITLADHRRNIQAVI